MNKKITEAIIGMLEKSDSVIIAIEGPCTSGKTTLANEISALFTCNLIHMDDFFLPFDMRTEERMNEIGGNIDYERFYNEVVQHLKEKTPFSYGKFSCNEGKINKSVTVEQKPLTIIEGVYSMHPYFGDIYDLKLFLDINEDTQIQRLKKRSPENLEKFINQWIPMENEYFKKFDIRNKCDLIIENG